VLYGEEASTSVDAFSDAIKDRSIAANQSGPVRRPGRCLIYSPPSQIIGKGKDKGSGGDVELILLFSQS